MTARLCGTGVSAVQRIKAMMKRAAWPRWHEYRFWSPILAYRRRASQW